MRDRATEATRRASLSPPPGFCFCGCGKRTRLARNSNPNEGIVKGKPLRYLQGHGMRDSANRERRAISEPYRVDPETGCWLWMLTLDLHGYGLERGNARHRLAHRNYYEKAHGPIPEGWTIHHVCETKRCVNPAHLVALTLREHHRIQAEMRGLMGRLSK